MLRTGIAAATAALALAAAPTASATGASHCAHRASTPRHGSRSYHQSSCRKGHPRRHRSGGAHLLYFTAHNGRCPYAQLQPSATDLAKVRAATLCLVNRERAARGERPLHWNVHLVRAAQAHTESMAFGDYFEHDGPRGSTPLSRMRNNGYIYGARVGFEVGENIGWGSLWLGTPRAVVAAWMASAGHRANILDGRYRDTGIGVSPHTNLLAHGQAGGIYTQDFGVTF